MANPGCYCACAQHTFAALRTLTGLLKPGLGHWAIDIQQTFTLIPNILVANANAQFKLRLYQQRVSGLDISGDVPHDTVAVFFGVTLHATFNNFLPQYGVFMFYISESHTLPDRLSSF